MKFEDLKPDSYVRWKAERMFKAWNTYGKVVNLTKNTVTILTYDDFKETTLNKGGEAVSDEIELSTKEEVEDYITLEISKRQLKKAEMDVEHKRKLREIDSVIEKYNIELNKDKNEINQSN